MPLRVTRPAPSSTTRDAVFRTRAVSVMRIVTGRGPQANRISPPPRTAATTARDVQLAGVPVPTTRPPAGAAVAGAAVAGATARSDATHVPPASSARSIPTA